MTLTLIIRLFPSPLKSCPSNVEPILLFRWPLKFWKNLILNCTKAKWGLTLVEEKRFKISCRSSEACLVVKGKFSYHLLSYGNIKLSMKSNVFHIALVFLKGLEVLRHYKTKLITTKSVKRMSMSIFGFKMSGNCLLICL